MHEVFVEYKYFRLGEIAENLCKRVAELELQVKPNTPPEVLEERRKETTEAATRIEEAKVLCSREFKQFS